MFNTTSERKCLKIDESRIKSVQGDMVAALVKGPEDENWILAEVVAYNSVTGKYDVDDIDEEQKDRHTLSKRCKMEFRTLSLKHQKSYKIV